jgi:uncharacterized protein DUF6228
VRVTVDNESDRGSLRFGDPDRVVVAIGRGEADDYDHDFTHIPVSISSRGLSAQSGVVSIEDAHGLRAFFHDLSADWRGVDSERSWESVHSDLKIDARRDGRGHVALLFTLRERYWTVNVEVELEAGEETSRAAAAIAELLGDT